ncbi:MAG: S41 family peptidase [Planctomycetota bacterium]
MKRALALVTSAAIGLTLAAAQGTGPDASVERWTTRGYGYLLEREGDELRVFTHCALGDLPVGTARAEAPDSGSFFDPELGGVELRASATDGAVVVDWDLTSHPVALDPAASPPRLPTDSQRADALFNFDWFCALFSEHYAFFELRGVDWPQATARAREALGSAPDAATVFRSMGELIELLDDGHCSIEAPEDLWVSGRPDPDPDAEDRPSKFRRLVDRRYLKGEYVRACRGRLTAGWVEDEIGYLRLDGMWGGRRKLQRGLDRAFDELAGARALIVDVRFNGGGDDRYGFKLSRRLIEERVLAVTKAVRSDPRDPAQCVAAGEFHLAPSDRPGFRGPVALLVSRYTLSAAEVFGMSLLERKGGLTVIGEPSGGALSDVLETELPNGWLVGLSNEVYRTADGRCFEHIGLPVDVPCETVRTAHLEERVDPALEAAVGRFRRDEEGDR